MIRTTFFLLCIIWAEGAPAACEKTIRVIEFSPYSMKEGGNWQGLNIDISKRILKELGCSPKFVNLPFARAMSLLRMGQVDIIFQLTILEDRKAHIQFVGPTHTERLILATSERIEKPIHTLQDLLSVGNQYGIQRGLHMGPYFENLVNQNPKIKAKLRYMSAVEPLITMVNKHRLDGFFIDSLHFEYMKRHNVEYRELIKQPTYVYETNVYMGLNKKTFTPAQLKKAQKTFIQLRQSGYLNDLKAKHVGSKK